MFSKISETISHLFRRKTTTKVSIITSVFDGDRYIRSFMEDITRQTHFPYCELILINPNSPGNEESVILEYIEKYPDNIVYKKLDEDPGLYECWNMGAKMATGEYLTNANLDDRRAPTHIEEHSRFLDTYSQVSMVSAVIKVTKTPHETWETTPSQETWFNSVPKFYDVARLFRKVDGELTSQNIVHCMPVWRKSLHDVVGYFNQDEYDPHCDWELWIRAGLAGLGYGFIHKPLGLYLFDEGSHNNRNDDLRVAMNRKIVKDYWVRVQEFVK